ncbi:MAG: sigma-54 dependent transcriptional regulator, partial [Planctomycetota bacterium]
MNAATSILLVDDDYQLVRSLAQWLQEEGFDVATAANVAEAIAKMGETPADLVITDLRLGDEDGFDIIHHCKRHHPDSSLLVMSGYATPATAVEAVRAGAFDLLTKPVIDDELMLAIDRAVNQNQIEKQNESLRRQLDARSGMENILSHDYRMMKIFDVIDNVADAKASILITGENGTGKSMIARAIHNRSGRRGGPFVEVACGALPDNLLESELFGHVAGAYTGANTDRQGKFELADGGTLFLDEIGTATPAMQVKLLRVLQELQFERLGGTETQQVDTRVILATNEDLNAAVERGTFRQDLFYRINVVNIVLPALHERPGDIPLLVDHFLRGAAETADRDVDGFDRDAMTALQAYRWPGNVRQLQNVVERAVLLSSTQVLSVHDLPPEVLQRTMAGNAATSMQSDDALSQRQLSVPNLAMRATTLREALEAPEREIILQALRRHNWNRNATADQLDINRTT